MGSEESLRQLWGTDEQSEDSLERGWALKDGQRQTSWSIRSSSESNAWWEGKEGDDKIRGDINRCCSNKVGMVEWARASAKQPRTKALEGWPWERGWGSSPNSFRFRADQAHESGWILDTPKKAGRKTRRMGTWTRCTEILLGLWFRGQRNEKRWKHTVAAC